MISQAFTVIFTHAHTYELCISTYVSAHGHGVLIQHAQSLSMSFSRLYEVRGKHDKACHMPTE